MPVGEGIFRIENVPMYMPELGLGDLVRCELEDGDWWTAAYVKDSGSMNPTIISMIDDPETEVRILAKWATRLEGLGAVCEIDEALPCLAVSIDKEAKVAEIRQQIVKAEGRSAIEVEIMKYQDWWDSE